MCLSRYACIAIITILQSIPHCTWVFVRGFGCLYGARDLKTLVHVTYFYDEKKCGFLRAKQIFGEFNQEINFPGTAKWKNTSVKIMKLMTLFDILWIFFSFLLLIVSCSKNKKCKCTISFFWVIIAIILIVLDLLSAVIYGLHVTKASSFSKWLDLVGVSEASNYQLLDSEIKFNFELIPLLMMFISLRFVILFYLNILFTFQLCQMIYYRSETYNL